MLGVSDGLSLIEVESLVEEALIRILKCGYPLAAALPWSLEDIIKSLSGDEVTGGHW
ncbi:hypothetical protein [Nonomuraea solani]|uniref:hypothetical protein n=1 Tax=Nonomuraea solani TaxID=1144553 RepID=UPI0013567D1A|nr:hypothetical protein [Nonomuraea solani]